jgi:hypothetical protein
MSTWERQAVLGAITNDDNKGKSIEILLAKQKRLTGRERFWGVVVCEKEMDKPFVCWRDYLNLGRDKFLLGKEKNTSCYVINIYAVNLQDIAYDHKLSQWYIRMLFVTHEYYCSVEKLLEVTRTKGPVFRILRKHHFVNWHPIDVIVFPSGGASVIWEFPGLSIKSSYK